MSLRLCIIHHRQGKSDWLYWYRDVICVSLRHWVINGYFRNSCFNCALLEYCIETFLLIFFPAQSWNSCSKNNRWRLSGAVKHIASPYANTIWFVLTATFGTSAQCSNWHVFMHCDTICSANDNHFSLRYDCPAADNNFSLRYNLSNNQSAFSNTTCSDLPRQRPFLCIHYGTICLAAENSVSLRCDMPKQLRNLSVK